LPWLVYHYRMGSRYETQPTYYSASDREMEFPAEFGKSLKGLLSFSPDFQSRALKPE
jgi:hypothetical protein